MLARGELKSAALAIPNTTGDFYDRPDVYTERHQKQMISCGSPWIDLVDSSF